MRPLLRRASHSLRNVARHPARRCTAIVPVTAPTPGTSLVSTMNSMSATLSETGCVEYPLSDRRCTAYTAHEHRSTLVTLPLLGIVKPLKLLTGASDTGGVVPAHCVPHTFDGERQNRPSRKSREGRFLCCFTSCRGCSSRRARLLLRRSRRAPAGYGRASSTPAPTPC